MKNQILGLIIWFLIWNITYSLVETKPNWAMRILMPIFLQFTIPYLLQKLSDYLIKYWHEN
jgi:uncharacterized membrane protein